MAFDAIKISTITYLHDRGVYEFNIDGSIEIFSHDWYMVRLGIVLKTDLGFNGMYLEEGIRGLKPEINILNQVKMDFIQLVGTSTKYDYFQLLNDYIQHYLYKEPILALDDEIKHIYQVIHKINYNMVSERFHEIISNLTII